MLSGAFKILNIIKMVLYKLYTWNPPEDFK